MKNNLGHTATLRREIHPEIRVLDDKQGIVEYLASNQTLDSYNEIILAAGWRFDDFQKNAPFVDSHNYTTIKNILGRVLDFKVDGDKLVETVKWAIEINDPTGHPSHSAKWGFEMTKAGYLKAVSVGFMPVRYISRHDHDQLAWSDACAAVKVDPEKTDCRCIYLEQQQKELSACVIGANPDAVARAYKAGILNDDALKMFSAEHSKRTIADSTDGPAAVELARQRERERFLVELQLKINSL